MCVKFEAEAACSKCPCGKYTTKSPFLGSVIEGPAQACQSSMNIGEAATPFVIVVEIEEEQKQVDEDKQQTAASSTSLTTWFKSISIHTQILFCVCFFTQLEYQTSEQQKVANAGKIVSL